MEKYKILIVEDERITLRNLEYILKKEGYEVTSTTSGVNALKLLQEEKFDLVLTDLKLEKVDGIEILEKCKEVEPDTEVIIITAYATISSAIEKSKTQKRNHTVEKFNRNWRKTYYYYSKS